MPLNLYWLQTGGCGGDTMSLLSAELPNFLEALELLDIKVLWHPSLSNIRIADMEAIVDRLVSGEQSPDVLCLEGAMIRGPRGTGMYDTFRSRSKKDLIRPAKSLGKNACRQPSSRGKS